MYVLAISGASLITSTSIWLFRDSIIQTSEESGVKDTGKGTGDQESKPNTNTPTTGGSSKPNGTDGDGQQKTNEASQKPGSTGGDTQPKATGEDGASGKGQGTDSSGSQDKTKNEGTIDVVTVNVSGDGKNVNVDGILNSGTTIQKGQQLNTGS